MSAQAPPGFYADPSQPGRERWWDGSAWGEQTRKAPPGVPAPGQSDVPTKSMAIMTAWFGLIFGVVWCSIPLFMILVVGGGMLSSGEATGTMLLFLAIPLAFLALGLYFIVSSVRTLIVRGTTWFENVPYFKAARAKPLRRSGSMNGKPIWK